MSLTRYDAFSLVVAEAHLPTPRLRMCSCNRIFRTSPFPLNMNSHWGGPSCSMRCLFDHVVKFAVHLSLVSACPSTTGTVVPATASVYTSLDPDSLLWNGDSSKFSKSGSYPNLARHKARTRTAFNQPISRRSASTVFETLYFLFGFFMFKPCADSHILNQRLRSSTPLVLMPRVTLACK